MKKLREIQVEDLMNRSWIPYVYYFLITAFLHIFGYEMYGDDIAMFAFLKDSVWDEFFALNDILSGWSSRFMVNPPIHIMMHFDYKVWLFFEIIIFMVLFRVIIKLTNNEPTVPHLYICASLMCLVVYLDFDEVGWVVTTMTYVWVAVAGFCACLTIKKSYDDKKISWYMYPVYLFLTLYASNKEEVSVMFTIIFAVAVIFSVIKGKKYIMLMLQFLLSITNLFIHLFSGNNIERYEIRTSLFTEKHTFFDKMVIGFTTTLRHIIFEKNFVFFVFCIVLALVVWFSLKKIVPRILSLVPLVLWFMTWVPGEIDYLFGSNVTRGPRVIATAVLGVVAVLSVFICIYYLYGVSDRTVMLVTVLIAGFAGRCVVGFANSGWQRYERSYTFLYLVLIMVACALACDVWHKLSYRKKQVLFGVIVVLGQLGVSKNILETGII